ncbi:hypothetical protein [Serratia ureilytica]|jgi:hypothetical protein|uniref:hypothetical protein n=1 Tax=Serratia ureilytica TaxID=300181 RepID=UPI0019D1F90F|nr:hypothetical protein [Serratia ureilytica]MBN5214265.1 hypothetical protein [Serratia ureilytica]
MQIILEPNEFFSVRIDQLEEEYLNDHMREQLGDNCKFPVYVVETTIGPKREKIHEYFKNGEYDELFKLAGTSYNDTVKRIK